MCSYSTSVIQPISRREILERSLIAIQHQIDLLLVDQSRLAAELVDTDAADDFDHSAYDWIRINCHLTSNAVIDRVRVGRRIPELRESVQAVKAREIGFAHLVVLARTAGAVGEKFDEARLLKLAKEHSPGKFHYKCLHFQHAADPKAYAEKEFEKYEQRFLRLSRWEDGSLILQGMLDPADGVAFRAALEPLARKSGAHDLRTREQRLADAFVDLTTGGRKQTVMLQVTASIETLLGRLGAPGAENEFSLPISSKTVERWACDSSISRILLQDSVVIDVGRAERTIKGPRRRALIARDQHCQWPGCDRPASFCDGHHLVHWVFGGGGEIANQVLLCGRHHRLVHEGGWQLVKAEDGNLMTIAPTVTFGYARGPD